MADVTINVRDNGPLLVQGAISVVDADGNTFPTNPDKAIALCRCGTSANKPFCDGSHKTCGFVADNRAGGS